MQRHSSLMLNNEDSHCLTARLTGSLTCDVIKQYESPSPCVQRGTATVLGRCSLSLTPLRSTTLQAPLSTSTPMLAPVSSLSHSKSKSQRLCCSNGRWTRLGSSLRHLASRWTGGTLGEEHALCIPCAIHSVVTHYLPMESQTTRLLTAFFPLCRFIESALSSVDRSVTPWVVLSKFPHPLVQI